MCCYTFQMIQIYKPVYMLNDLQNHIKQHLFNYVYQFHTKTINIIMYQDSNISTTLARRVSVNAARLMHKSFEPEWRHERASGHHNYESLMAAQLPPPQRYLLSIISSSYYRYCCTSGIRNQCISHWKDIRIWKLFICKVKAHISQFACVRKGRHYTSSCVVSFSKVLTLF